MSTHNCNLHRTMLLISEIAKFFAFFKAFLEIFEVKAFWQD